MTPQIPLGLSLPRPHRAGKTGSARTACLSLPVRISPGLLPQLAKRGGGHFTQRWTRRLTTRTAREGAYARNHSIDDSPDRLKGCQAFAVRAREHVDGRCFARRFHGQEPNQESRHGRGKVIQELGCV